ncbi:MAG TPA: hypothetical protein VM580_34390 [Labilithrix sp.]|nr:hypothetical protein [Labilithrix sp.]
MSRWLAVPLAIFASIAIFTPGCASDGDPDAFDTGDAGRDETDGGGGNETICLLNNCDRDRDCADCSDQRTVCSQSEHRCVACGPTAGNKGCTSGTYCTKYGDCAPDGVQCGEDANGVPTISCETNADCAACGPSFKVCDPASKKCVGCLPENTTNCQSTDVCKNNTCVPKCPAECSSDSACDSCGAPGNEAHACNKHVCAECSPTKACANGGRCDYAHGTCIKSCGLGRPGKTNCNNDNDCAGCTGTTKCKLPLNGGEGECVAPATGCSDLGNGVAVLPEPFSRVTNTCSTNADCSNVSTDLNVGKLLRDITGIETIRDGTIQYGMRACASVAILDRACGVCVPCKQDTDCLDVDVTQVAGDMFGPVGSITSAILLDQVFGPNDHKIHTFCQNVAGDYGVCRPCPNPLSRCAQTAAVVPPTGSCGHDVCTTGTALGQNCDPCVAAVCAKDPYCCVKEWDSQCKVDVDLHCGTRTCEPDKCIYHEEGWYCREDASLGGYRCAGAPGSEQIAEGHQCGPNRECHRNGVGSKAPAILCETEADNDPECPLGSLGKPRCFAK